MTTHVTTHNPVRSDVTGAAAVEILDSTGRRAGPSRSWALAGIGAGLAGIGTVISSGMIDAVYRDDLVGDPAGIQEALSQQSAQLMAFHTFTTVGAVLLLVFAAGLHRRLRAAMPDSLVPMLALTGLAGTAVVSVLGSGLDTEFMMDLGQKDLIQPANAAMFNHWVGTIPWLWTLAGLAGLGLFSAFRRGVVPRWIGLVGLVLGGLTVLLGVSPAQYMAGGTGSLWLLVTAVGFTVGDKAHRAAQR